MVTHKFKVGQSVQYTATRTGVPASDRDYKIVRLHPLEQGLPTYRIKSISETFERIAKENELRKR